MGRNSNYENTLFKEFEKVNLKLDNLIEKNKKQALTIYDSKLTIKKLNKELDKKNELIEKLIAENEKLKNKNDKNSSNSSKPSSSNYTTPKKKTSPNEYNSREKSNKKVGGQIGHKGYNLSKENIEKIIKNNNIEVREHIHYIKGTSSTSDLVKYKFDIEIKTYVEKHIFKYTKNSQEKLPKEFYTDVTYGNNIKSLSIHLGAYNVISYDRLSDFFSVISNNIIKISNGTLVNFLDEFSTNSESSISNLVENILLSNIIYTDETGTKFNKKNLYVRNYSNQNSVVYKAHLNKGHNPIKDDNILPNFCGGIMGDHDTTLYSYGTKNFECIVHLSRYIEELIQNIPYINWTYELKKLLFEIKNTREIAKMYGIKKFDKDIIDRYKKKYDELIQLAKNEMKDIKSTYYKAKAMRLYRRLIKYKKNHLYFASNFSVPFDNNLSERDLRIFKTKTKISGGFRSFKGAEHFVNALSIIKTSIKRKINPFDSILKIFNNEILFS